MLCLLPFVDCFSVEFLGAFSLFRFLFVFILFFFSISWVFYPVSALSPGRGVVQGQFRGNYSSRTLKTSNKFMRVLIIEMRTGQSNVDFSPLSFSDLELEYLNNGRSI